MSINGIYREQPLRKARKIASIEYFFPEGQLKKLLAYRDHMELLDFPEECMKVYRADGSYVSIKSVFGEVFLVDSRYPTATRHMSADSLIPHVIT